MTTRRLRRITAALTDLFASPEPIMVEGVRASRAIYLDADHSEVEIKFMLEGKIPITLRMPPRYAHELITQLTTAYTAINPPINSRGMGMASWEGMNE